MVKSLSILFFIVNFSLEASAQMTLGVQGGSNFSTMSFTNNPAYKYTEVNYLQGFVGGLVVQFIPEKHTGIQAEFNYSQKGWVEIDTTSGNNVKYQSKMDYLELPILTHVNIGSGNFRGLFNLGPYIGYGLNRENTTSDLNAGTSVTEEYTFDKDLDNRIDFGLLLGFGFEYRMPFGKLAMEARYSIGLGDIDKDKDNQSEVSQFRVLGIMARYSIPLNGKAATPKKDQQ